MVLFNSSDKSLGNGWKNETQTNTFRPHARGLNMLFLFLPKRLFTHIVQWNSDPQPKPHAQSGQPLYNRHPKHPGLPLNFKFLRAHDLSR